MKNSEFNPKNFQESELPKMDAEIVKVQDLEIGQIHYSKHIETVVFHNEENKPFKGVVYEDLLTGEKKCLSARAFVSLVSKSKSEHGFSWKYEGLKQSDNDSTRRYHSFEVKDLQPKQ